MQLIIVETVMDNEERIEFYNLYQIEIMRRHVIMLIFSFDLTLKTFLK